MEMKNKLQYFLIKAGKLERHHTQLIVIVFTLFLFVLAGGAPEGGGGCGGC
jgi:hypothetical protein